MWLIGFVLGGSGADIDFWAEFEEINFAALLLGSFVTGG